MRWKALLVLAMALVMAAAMAAVASAGRPTCAEDPTRPWCDDEPPVTPPTVPEDIIWTCEARNDNGAMWPTGTYTDGAYHGDTVPVCIDILEEHRNVEDWIVEWFGVTAKGTVKGLKFVFEEEVHDNVYVETVVTSMTSGDEPWLAALGFGGTTPGNLVFVSMPHSGDEWETFSITITPLSGGHDG